MKILTITMALFLMTVFPVMAETKSGDVLPHNLNAQDQNKTLQTFESLKGDNGAVLVFVRSAKWCPYCQKQLIEMNEASSDLNKLGYNIVSISYDSTDVLDGFAQKHKIDYAMLSDPKSEIIKAFGILNEEMEPETKYYGIPYPAVYIVGTDGVVQAKLAEDGYKERPSVTQIIETITQEK